METTLTAFTDLDLNATAYRAVAITMHNFECYDEAGEYAKLSLSKAENEMDKFAALLEQANAEFYLAKQYGNDDYDDEEDDDEDDEEDEEGDEEDNDEDKEDDDEDKEEDDEMGDEDEEINPEDLPNPRYQKPHDTIEEALKLRPTSPEPEVQEMIRQALFILGSCQYQLCKYRECVVSIEDARTLKTGSLITGDVLTLIPAALYECKPEGFSELMDKLQSWTLFDRMAWLTFEHDWSEDWDPHVILQQSAKETGQEEFAIKVYTQVIRYLELRRSAGHVRNRLAGFYYYVQQDVDKAKELWLQVRSTKPP